MYFLALSQAPPPVVIEIATNRPVTIVPINRPPSACAPAAGPPSHLNPNMTTTGTSTGSKDGMIISLIADLVSMSTALSYCGRSEEHTSELQSLMRISYAVFCLKKKTNNQQSETTINIHTRSN